MFKDLKKFQAELDMYYDVNYASKVETECAKAKGELVSHKMSFEKSFNEYTRKINDLNQTISEMKKELFTHQETISIMSQEKEAQKKFHKTREDKEIEKVIALENKIKVLDDISGQSVQTINMLNHNCKISFVKPEFIKKAQTVNPCMYDIGCYNDNLALMLAPESDETIRLSQESQSKLNLKYFNSLEKKIVSLQSQLETQRTQFLNEIDRISREYYYADLMNAILGVYTDLDEATDLQVIFTTSVSRPQLKSNQLEDRVMHNNSQVKKREVEEHRRNLKFSKNKTFVTACNDSLKAKTSNVNFVCVTYGKCVLSENHDRCVLHYINGVDSRTKQPIIVPISTREPKNNVNQTVATTNKKTVTLESMIQKPRSTFRKLYEHASKTCSWWYSKLTPSGYTWKPKSNT
ncbi:hypothetical protein Tco_1360117 [Tanacetum coccineum]